MLIDIVDDGFLVAHRRGGTTGHFRPAEELRNHVWFNFFHAAVTEGINGAMDGGKIALLCAGLHV